jgi:membrane protease YdiL (CAAX protease family)
LFFLIVLALLTAAAHVAASGLGGNWASLLVMWSPGAAAILVMLFSGRSLRTIGWRPGPLKWWALAWLLPLLYAVPAYGLVWLTGLGDVPNPTFLERARFTLGMAEGSDALVIVAAFFYISVVNLLPTAVLVLGEEIGWRGYLLPELTHWIGFRGAAMASGIVWAAWHLPGVLSGGYGTMGTPLLYQTVCFTAFVLTSAVVLAWLRMQSGSLWPAVILHATHNGLIQAFFNRITADTGATNYFIGEFGIAMIPFILLLAGYCWHQSRTLDRTARRTGQAVHVSPSTTQA